MNSEIRTIISFGLSLINRVFGGLFTTKGDEQSVSQDIEGMPQQCECTRQVVKL